MLLESHLMSGIQELLSHATRQLPDAVSFLKGMVEAESPSLTKGLVDKCAAIAGRQFAAIGGEVDYVRADRVGDHLIARFKGNSGNQVLLLGHTDTVWPEGEIHKRPFSVADGRALGPGVFDMKAGIVLMWMAVDALKKNGGLEGSVTILLTSDEEIGGTSSRALIENEASASRAVLVLEPSLPGGALKTARKGVGRFTIKAVGRAAHAGIDPEKGINSIEEIAHQILKLQQMTDAARGTTVSVGVVQGGTRSNVIPAEAAIEVDVRIASVQEAQRVSENITRLSPELHGARLEIRGGISRPPMERTLETARLFDMAHRIGTQLGLDLQEGSTGGASDGNVTSALGIPTLDGLGAVGGGAHAVHEWVEIESLPTRAALVAELIARIGL
jgi:glutamate carboxypeptidase